MIRAEKADRIMKLYESDYDNFLNKLRAKKKSKKEEAAKKKAEAETKKTEAEKKKTEATQAEKTVGEAEAHKKAHLGEKAKALIDKAGGIEGAKSTVANVMKYFKSPATPSDYEVGAGKTDEKKSSETIMGLPPIAVYVGGSILVLAALYGLSLLMKKGSTTQLQTASNPSSIPAPVFQQAA